MTAARPIKTQSLQQAIERDFEKLVGKSFQREHPRAAEEKLRMSLAQTPVMADTWGILNGHLLTEAYRFVFCRPGK